MTHRVLAYLQAQILAAQHHAVRAQVGRWHRSHTLQLGLRNLAGELRGDYAGDIVLKRENIAQIALVAIGPHDAFTLDVHQLNVEAQTISLPLHAAGQGIAGSELLARATEVRRRIAEMKGRVTSDHQDVTEAAQVGDDVAGHSVAQMGVAWILRKVPERQDDNSGPVGRCKRRQLFHRRRGRGCCQRSAAVKIDGVGLDRCGHVLQALTPDRRDLNWQLAAHDALHALRNADAARSRQLLQAGGNVHLVAVVGIGFDDHFAEIDANSEYRLVRIAVPNCVVAKLALQVDGKPDGLKCAVEHGLDGVALDIEDAAFVVADQGFEEVDAPHDASMRTELVPLHRAAVVHDIGKQNRRQTLPYLVVARRGHGRKLPFP